MSYSTTYCTAAENLITWTVSNELEEVGREVKSDFVLPDQRRLRDLALLIIRSTRQHE